MNPLAITDFYRDNEQLERFWIYGMLVAGKNSDWAAPKIEEMFRDKPADVTPLQWLKENDQDLENKLVAHRVGNYRDTMRGLRDSYDLDLRTATVEQLEGVHKIGPKTARFFILHSREGVEDVLPLDTQWMKFLREHGATDKHQTPSGRRRKDGSSAYTDLERVAIALARRYYPGLALADIDLILWARYSGRLEFDLPEPVLPGEPEEVVTDHHDDRWSDRLDR
jgi:hypothetical protein